MTQESLELPYWINGEEVYSEITTPVHSYNGEIVGQLHLAKPRDLRKTKRAIRDSKSELEKLHIGEIVSLIKCAIEFFPGDNKELEQISYLTGTPIQFLHDSTEGMKKWAQACDQYLEQVFGRVDYESASIEGNTEGDAKRLYRSRGPIVSILPQNDYSGEILYILVNALLSKSPLLIKPSSNGAASLPSLQLLKALRTAVNETDPRRYESILKSYHIVNIAADDARSPRLADLFAHGDQLIAFGSEESLHKIESDVAEDGVALSNCVRFGTGFSVAIILSDADLTLAAREVAAAGTADKGNQCCTTSVAYVAESVYDDFVAQVRDESQAIQVGNPLDSNTQVGVVPPDTLEQVAKRCEAIYGQRVSQEDFRERGLVLIERDPQDYVEEIPAPITVIKPVKDKYDAIRRLSKDVEQLKLSKNLVTAVFSTDQASIDAIAHGAPSHMVKVNAGSHRLAFLTEHQGIYPIRELLDLTLVET